MTEKEITTTKKRGRAERAHTPMRGEVDPMKEGTIKEEMVQTPPIETTLETIPITTTIGGVVAIDLHQEMAEVKVMIIEDKDLLAIIDHLVTITQEMAQTEALETTADLEMTARTDNSKEIFQKRISRKDLTLMKILEWSLKTIITFNVKIQAVHPCTQKTTSANKMLLLMML